MFGALVADPGCPIMSFPQVGIETLEDEGRKMHPGKLLSNVRDDRHKGLATCPYIIHHYIQCALI